MNLFLIFLWSFYPVSTFGANNGFLPSTTFTISYSSNGLVSTSIRKLLISRNNLKLSVGLNTIRALKGRRTFSSSTMFLSYKKDFTSGLSIRFEGYLNIPLFNSQSNYRFIKGGIEP